MNTTRNRDLYINDTKLAQLLKTVGEKDRDIIQSMYLLMCCTNSDREELSVDLLESIIPIYGKERIQQTLDKWFIRDENYPYIYTPLVSILDFVDWDVELYKINKNR